VVALPQTRARAENPSGVRGNLDRPDPCLVTPEGVQKRSAGPIPAALTQHPGERLGCGMATVTIELPPQTVQTDLNLRRWAELLCDPVLAQIEGRVETDRHGHIISTLWSDHDKRLAISGLPPVRTLRKHHGSVFRPENRLILFPQHPRATVRHSRQQQSKANPNYGSRIRLENRAMSHLSDTGFRQRTQAEWLLVVRPRSPIALAALEVEPRGAFGGGLGQSELEQELFAVGAYGWDAESRRRMARSGDCCCREAAGIRIRC
jgi:hypothetical protein